MKRSRVVFVLSDPQSSSAIYKTDDIIDGEVLFTPHQQVKAENVTISFQGDIQMAGFSMSLLTIIRNCENGSREHVHSHTCIDKRPRKTISSDGLSGVRLST